LVFHRFCNVLMGNCCKTNGKQMLSTPDFWFAFRAKWKNKIYHNKQTCWYKNAAPPFVSKSWYILDYLIFHLFYRQTKIQWWKSFVFHWFGNSFPSEPCKMNGKQTIPPLTVGLRTWQDVVPMGPQSLANW